MKKIYYLVVKDFSTIKSTLLVFVLSFTIGCVSIKPAGVKSGKKLYSSFYVGEDGTQYFIKPLTFTSSKSKEEILMDYTFRYRDEIKDSAIINFTILSPSIFKSVDSLVISNENSQIASKNVELMFNEKKKNGYVSRLTFKIPLSALQQAFSNENWSVTLHSKQYHSLFEPVKKAKKNIKKLDDNLFILF